MIGNENLKYKYGNRYFWCRGYYVDKLDRNQNAIKEYIKNQLEEDILNDQISLKEYIEPFIDSQSKYTQNPTLLKCIKLKNKIKK